MTPGSQIRPRDGFTRRETLRAGALSLLAGVELPRLLWAEEHAKPQSRPGKAKSVIVLYLHGGAPSQDMYDLKPEAPADIRGEFKPISTSAPGIHVCEHLPHTARWMHKAAIVRTVNHKAGCHNTLPSYTGYEEPVFSPEQTKDTYPPSMGSVCQYLNKTPGVLPDYVYMPCYLGWGYNIVRPGIYAGFLGKQYDPLCTVVSPYVDNPPDREYHPQVLRGEPKLPYSQLLEGMTEGRLGSRRNLLAGMGARPDAATPEPLDPYSRQRERAFNLLTSPEAKAAFDLTREDPKTRERYGNSLFGQSALVARRLVEAGVRFINVSWDSYWGRLKLQFESWDTHQRNFPILREYNLPYLDMTYGALLDDLDGRGLLDETLVVVMSDFGRTPKVNSQGGRDHWSFCYSVLFAGAGIRGGTVHGASDKTAAFIKDGPVSTGDICATIYKCLGIDPHMFVPDHLGRPINISQGGQPIESILA